MATNEEWWLEDSPINCAVMQVIEGREVQPVYDQDAHEVFEEKEYNLYKQIGRKSVEYSKSALYKAVGGVVGIANLFRIEL